MPFDQHPFSVAVNPFVRHPVPTWLWRTIPAAGSPNIVVALPAVVAINPHESLLRRPTAFFNDWGRGANADHNLRKRCRRK